MSAAESNFEHLLLKDRAIVIVSLMVLTAVAWSYLFFLSFEMAQGEMNLMGMKLMGFQPWTSVTFVLMFVMWSVMMIGMMVPSATPMILIYARVQRKNLPHEHPGLRIALFTFGYLLLWLVFSLGATLLQWSLGSFALLSPNMTSSSRYLGAAIFFAAGIYQLTPLKQACLAHCRSPISFLSSHWRQGDLGAFQMGIVHGAYCLGCCWFLMGLLFFGGVMNLLWIAAIATFVLLEKILPAAQLVSRVSGIGMLSFSLFLLFQ